MQIDTPLDAETEAGLFLEITSIARRHASKIVGREDARDIAQDVVLECLVRIREGTSPIDLAKLPGLVRGMARRRSFDLLRRADRRPRNDEDFMRELTDSTHSWMQPDAAVREVELEELRERTLASLPEGCRRAYTSVREDGLSYEDAAGKLGMSRAAVNAHVVKAQRVFRQELREHDVPTPPRMRGGRQPKAQKRSGGARTDTLPRPSILTRMLARSPPSDSFTFSRRPDADSAGQHVAVPSQRGSIPRQACR